MYPLFYTIIFIKDSDVYKTLFQSSVSGRYHAPDSYRDRDSAVGLSAISSYCPKAKGNKKDAAAIPNANKQAQIDLTTDEI